MLKNQINVVDLFCGIGGLTHGFQKEGFNVVAGIDNDAGCKYGYEVSNKTKFIEADIADVSADDLTQLFGKSELKVLVGCAPCQPFSGLNRRKPTKEAMSPLEHFAYLIKKTKPDIVSMENVRGLAKKEKYPVFAAFLKNLKACGYHYSYRIVDTSDYGVPQSRKRLVLLASRFGPIELIEPTHAKKKVTVKDAIGKLKPLEDGEFDPTDPLHRARKLSGLNKQRIKATPANGGSSKDWSDDLQLACHQKESGKTYRGTVYGRMRWNEPAPTMTTHCVGIGNGRFGHPEQDRAISLREAAIFQTFPRTYKFYNPDEKLVVGQVSKYIGNAVPVKLGRVIAKSINEHILESCK